LIQITIRKGQPPGLRAYFVKRISTHVGQRGCRSTVRIIAASITARRNDHGMLLDILAAIASKTAVECAKLESRRYFRDGAPPAPSLLLRGDGAFFVWLWLCALALKIRRVLSHCVEGPTCRSADLPFVSLPDDQGMIGHPDLHTLWMNDGVPIRVHFVCRHCKFKLPYRAKKEFRSRQFSGFLDCVECTKAAYEWTGFYHLVDLKPIRMPDRMTGKWLPWWDSDARQMRCCVPAHAATFRSRQCSSLRELNAQKLRLSDLEPKFVCSARGLACATHARASRLAAAPSA
jgi:hypothetical protein